MLQSRINDFTDIAQIKIIVFILEEEFPAQKNYLKK